MSLYLCNYTWYESTAARPPKERDEAFARVFAAAEESNPVGADNMKGWFLYPGQSAGFLILEADSVEQLALTLRPYTELMTIDIRPVVAIDYGQKRQNALGSI